MREIFDKVHEHVETDLVQAVLCKSHAILVILLLTSNFTAPQLQFIEQLYQRVVTKLKLCDLLDAEGVRKQRQNNL